MTKMTKRQNATMRMMMNLNMRNMNLNILMIIDMS